MSVEETDSLQDRGTEERGRRGNGGEVWTWRDRHTIELEREGTENGSKYR